MLPGGYYYGTGRRKAAVARVRIRPGKGDIVINNRTPEAYFPGLRDRRDVTAPLEAAGDIKKMDVFISVLGGGLSGQAGAIRLGLARALMQYDRKLEASLRDRGYLTRDDREVERKKYGRRGARRRFQFSKR
ncbi:MAG: 30S ribosomal protein S9 [Phycisphaerae bacterium]